MNILVLSELFYPHGSGGELATYLYSRLLSKSGFNVVVVTNRFSSEPEVSRSENLIVYRLPLFNETKGGKYSLLRRFDILISSYVKKLMKWADVVYIPKFWFSAIPFAKAYGKPVIIHLHGYIPICPVAVLYDSKNDRVCDKEKICSPSCLYAYESGRRGVYGAVESTFLNLSVWRFLSRFVEYGDAVVCVSKAQRDIIIKYMPSLAGKVYVVYNPLPQLSLMEMNGNDLGYFGGPSHLKGFHVLLKAMQYQKLQGLSSVIVHATKFSGLREQFVSVLRKMGFVLYGKLKYDELDGIYRKVKAVVVPSVWRETFGYVVAEALLRGRVVIASRIGGIPELVEGCKGVFLFTPGDFTQLAENIAYVGSLNREVAVDLGFHNRQVFTSRFNYQKTLQNFMGILQRILRS